MKTQSNFSERRWKQHRQMVFLVGLCAACFSARPARADQIWLHQYDGFGGNNHPYAIAVDRSGNVVVTGASINQSGNYDYYTAKYDGGTGVLLWEARYDGGVGGEDRATGVAIDSQGNVTVTGYSANGNDPNQAIGFDFYTVQYDAAGHFVWEHRGPHSPGLVLATDAERINRVAVDGNGDVVVSGYTDGPFPASIQSLYPFLVRSFYTVKYSGASGSTIWEQWFVAAGTAWPLGLALDGAGNVIVTGAGSPCQGCYGIIETIKYAGSSGVPLWQRSYDSGNGDTSWPIGIALDPDGNVLLSGVTLPCCTGVQPVYYTAKYSSTDGNIVWQRTDLANLGSLSGGISRDYVVLQSIIADSAGNVIVNEGNGTAFDLAKFAAVDGTLVWGQRFRIGSNCDFGEPTALVIDTANNVVVTGDACLPNNNCGAHRFLTSKYRATDGSVLWQEAFGVEPNGPGDPFQTCSHGVAVDSSGNIVVIGDGTAAAGNYDYTTIKYAPSGTSLTTIACPASIVQSTDPGLCSAVVTFASPTATDACGNPLSVTCTPPSGSAFPVAPTTVTCAASDGTSCSFTVTVNDTQAPIVAAISAPVSPTAVDSPVNTSASFTDNCGPHTAVWDWGDSTTSAGTVTEANGSGSVAGNHVYSAAGVYTLTLTATDEAGNQGQQTFEFVVIYDPNAGFVTGGGWIDSPAGAYAPNPNLSGKATFGFVSKYQKGASVPTGQTEFQFQMASFDFKSTDYQWLVIAGPKAQYKGHGTVNGVSGYSFMLTATDGEINGGGGVDKFRIHITNTSTGGTVYDNVPGAADDMNNASPEAIAGGDIVIHSN